MKNWKFMLMLLGLTAVPLLARADGPAPATPAASGDAVTAAQGGAQDRADLERQMEEARRQMSEAAHRMAELSMQLNHEAVSRMAEMRGRMENLRHRGFLGIDVDDGNDTGGVTVSGITPGGPADKAGLREGDVVTAINGTALKSAGEDTAADQLMAFMRNTRPGDQLKLSYRRNGKAATATATAGSLKDFDLAFFGPTPPMPPIPPVPAMPPMPSEPVFAQRFPGGFNLFFGSGSRWGEMQLVALTPGLGQYFGTDKGLLVLHVPKDSALQLQEGDVIMQVGGRDPGTPPHVMRILSSYGPGESVKLDIMRKGKPQTLNVTLPKSADDDSTSAFNWVRSDDDSQDGSR